MNAAHSADQATTPIDLAQALRRLTDEVALCMRIATQARDAAIGAEIAASKLREDLTA